jgi:soluble lytic murein transglycosylase
VSRVRVVAALVLVAVLGVGAWLGWRKSVEAPDLSRWDALLERAAAEFGLDPNLLRALVAAESGGDPDAVSRAGAIGLCQVMPATAAEQATRLGMTDYARGRLQEPAVNLRLGASFLARMLRRFDGEVAYAVAAYNAGPTRVIRWRAAAPTTATPEQVVLQEGFAETRGHLQKVLRYWGAYRERYGEPE